MFNSEASQTRTSMWRLGKAYVSRHGEPPGFTANLKQVKVGSDVNRCNERYGEQRTLLRLDRFVANEAWRRLFPEANVLNSSMSASNHCLVTMFLRKRTPRKPKARRFFFEEMWTRDDRCREVVEDAWDPLRESP